MAARKAVWAGLPEIDKEVTVSWPSVGQRLVKDWLRVRIRCLYAPYILPICFFVFLIGRSVLVSPPRLQCDLILTCSKSSGEALVFRFSSYDKGSIAEDIVYYQIR